MPKHHWLVELHNHQDWEECAHRRWWLKRRSDWIRRASGHGNRLLAFFLFILRTSPLHSTQTLRSSSLQMTLSYAGRYTMPRDKCSYDKTLKPWNFGDKIGAWNSILWSTMISCTCVETSIPQPVDHGHPHWDDPGQVFRHSYLQWLGLGAPLTVHHFWGPPKTWLRAAQSLL